MDVETLIFLGVGLVGAVAAGAHLYGWIPPRYKTQLAAIQSSTAAAIGAELRAVFAEQEARLTAMQESVEDQADPILESLNGLPVKFREAFHEELQLQAEAAKAEMAAQMKAAEEAAKHAEEAFKMRGIRGSGIIKAEELEASRLVINGIAGPMLDALGMVLPDLAKSIREVVESDPDKALRLWNLAQRNPWFQKYVQPRIDQLMSNMVSTSSESVPAPGWGT